MFVWLLQWNSFENAFRWIQNKIAAVSWFLHEKIFYTFLHSPFFFALFGWCVYKNDKTTNSIYWRKKKQFRYSYCQPKMKYVSQTGKIADSIKNSNIQSTLVFVKAQTKKNALHCQMHSTTREINNFECSTQNFIVNEKKNIDSFQNCIAKHLLFSTDQKWRSQWLATQYFLRLEKHFWEYCHCSAKKCFAKLIHCCFVLFWHSQSRVSYKY